MNIENQPTRVQFQERQILRTRDLTDEQAYHLEMRRRHNLALHTWGIAYGLTLQVTEGNTVAVMPGIAIDGFGREVVVAQQTLVPNLNPNLSTGPFDVWLLYQLADASNGAEKGICGSRPPTRLRVEKPVVIPKFTAERRAPDANVSPERPPPDDPTQEWPIFLGKIEWRAADADPAGIPAWQIDLSERRYAGLVAEQIVSPAQGTRRTLIQNGSAPGLAPYPFAVYVWDGTEPGPDEASPALGVDKEVLALNAGRVTLGGDLVLVNGAALQFQANAIAADANAAGTDALGQAWRIYQYFKAAALTTTGKGANAPKLVSADADGYANELRVAMAGAPAGFNSVAIGRWTDKGLFDPVLTITDTGDVTVKGNLKVTGTITARLVQAPLADAGSGPATGPGGDPDLRQVLQYIAGGSDNRKRVLTELLKSKEEMAELLLKDPTSRDNFKNGVTTNDPTNKKKTALAQLAIEAALNELLDQLLDTPSGLGQFTGHLNRTRVSSLANLLLAATFDPAESGSAENGAAQVLECQLADANLNPFALAFSKNAVAKDTAGDITFPDDSRVHTFAKFLQDRQDSNDDFNKLIQAFVHWLAHRSGG